MELTVTNLMDAFKALEDLEDDDTAYLQSLKESRTFDIRSPQEMIEAEEFMKPVKKEVKLEVIDPDADSIEHLKHNEDYIGQMIMQCATCRSKIFLDAEELKVSDEDENIYNIELECPHCHKAGKGFSILGQVGKVVEEEPSVENDSLTASEDEPAIENDLEEVEVKEEEPNVEESEEDEVNVDEEESDGMETSAEDDTADMEDTTGEEYEEEIKYDDTEELPEVEEPKEEEEEVSIEDEIQALPEEEDKDEKKNESLTEDIDVPSLTVDSFFNKFVSPEKIKEITIWDIDEDSERQVYNGTFEEMPDSFRTAEIASFNVDGGKLVLNTDITADAIEGETVGDLLRWFDDEFDGDLSIEDAEQGELLAGTKASITDVYEELPLTFLNAPERVNIYCRALEVAESLKTPFKEALDMANPEDRLIAEIINGCGYSEGRADMYGTPEYWIAESIREKEDLGVIYRDYVMRCSEDIRKEFKDVTGYTDKVDEAMLEEKVAASTPGDMEEAIEEAKELLKSSKAYAVIYGYQKNGKFYGFEQPIVCRDKDNYADKAEIVDLRYRPTGSICTLFHHTVEESIDVDSRKALSKLIEECRNNKQPYSVKSRGNGKYTLLRESPEPFAVIEEPAIDGEVVDKVPSTEVDYSTDMMDPRDHEIVDKLMRISHDTAEAIQRHYGVSVDERAILADMIQDLQLVSGQLTPDQIADTPINQLTKQMYQAYEGFYEAMDEFVSFITGEPITTTQAQKLSQAVASLDDIKFSTEEINRQIAGPAFLQALRAGAIPGVEYRGNPRNIRLIEGDIGDVQCDEVGECDPREWMSKEEFEDFMNAFYDDNVDETVVFECNKVEMNEGKVYVDGKITINEDKEEPIEFILKPILNESFSGKEYEVTNSLTEEVLTFRTKGE